MSMEQGDKVFLATILVVDDTPHNLLILLGFLKKEYNVVTAESGEQALKYLEDNPVPLLILLDIRMPGMDGYETCKRIKANPKTRNVPIIFLTALTSEEDELLGLSLGAVDYVTKPFKLPILRSRIKTHIELQQKLSLLDNLSLIDPVLLVPNRQYFEYYIQKKWMRMEVGGGYLGIALTKVASDPQLPDEEAQALLHAVVETLRGASVLPGVVVTKYKDAIFATVAPCEQQATIVALVEGARRHLAASITEKFKENLQSVTLQTGLAISPKNGELLSARIVRKAEELLESAAASDLDAVAWELMS
jgi:PleD family two-component response regulator